MRRAQLTFGDGLIAEEVSDLRDHWMEAADRVLADEEIVAIVYEALGKRQNADGSWVNSADRFMEGDPNLVTAYALLALAHARVKA